MAYLDLDALAALDPEAYRARRPYPYANLTGVLLADAYPRLIENPPPLELFDEVYGVKRAHGQMPHDRLTLEYEDGLPLPLPWQELIDELREGPYLETIRDLVGVRDIELSFHWHWATRGNSVSPHCDAIHKVGSHILYLNTEDDWDPGWGGETLVLDDGGRFTRSSAPGFEDFDRIVAADAGRNRSLLFTRRGDSWHGVREITCPDGYYRKVFIIVLNRPGWRGRLLRLLQGPRPRTIP